MRRAALPLIVAVLAAAGPTSGRPLVPGLHELAEALRDRPAHAARLAHVRCAGFEEEPTEFHCRYRLIRDGRTEPCSAYIAIDGSAWVLIDTPQRRCA
jgi:hypothetical protein